MGNYCVQYQSTVLSNLAKIVHQTGGQTDTWDSSSTEVDKKRSIINVRQGSLYAMSPLKYLKLDNEIYQIR